MIDELAACQHGRIAAAQLVERGIGRHVIAWRLGTGALIAEHEGVYRSAAHPDSWRGRAQAAVLAAGPGAALSHLAAAHLWGFSAASPWIAVSAPRSRGRLAGVTVHRPRSLQEDVVELDGLRVTTVARTLIDLCAVLSAAHVARLCHEAEVLHLVTRAEIREVLERSRGRRGINKLRRITAKDVPLTRTELERRFVKIVLDAGLPAPRTNESPLIAGRLRELDAHWPEHKIAVELDSWRFHRTRERFESDRARDAALSAAGWTPIRFTWRRLTDNPEGVVDELSRLIDRPGPKVDVSGNNIQPTPLEVPPTPGLPSGDG